MLAGTIVARNYLGHARVLACSYQRWHPGERLVVLVLDEEDGTTSDAGEQFEIMRPADIGLSTHDFHQMAAIYDITELATAVKPWLLRALLRRGADVAVYLDPDVEVFADLTYLTPTALASTMLLVPHLSRPLPRDGREPKEENFLQAGVFNLGFIAVSEGAGPFLDWWAERLRWDCLDATSRGLYVDQRWVDVGAPMFPHAVLADLGINVAYWNLHDRRVVKDGDGYTVNGAPLRFFHFTGFRPTQPERLTRHLPPGSRVDDAMTPDLLDLCRAHAAHLEAHDHASWAAIPYRFARAGSVRLTRHVRRGYRDALLSKEPGCPTDPFVPEAGRAFARWASRMQRARLRKVVGDDIRRYVRAARGSGRTTNRT